MAAAKKNGKTGKSDQRSATDKLLDTALALAAEVPWQQLSVSRIANEAGVPVGEALMTLPSRLHILRALMGRIDATVLASLEGDPLDGSTKDKLFDILMRRFDALADHRSAMGSISRSLSRDPVTTACLGGRFLKSMALSLQAAGVSSEGCSGSLKAKALAAIQLNAFRVWLSDEDPGLAQTMKALDKGLSQAEKFAAMRRPSASEYPETA